MQDFADTQLGVDSDEGTDTDTVRGQVDIESLLGSIFGGAPKVPAAGVMERFDTLMAPVNAALETLDNESLNGHSHDYTATLNTDELRWVVAALGWFVDQEVCDNAQIANSVMDAAEHFVAAVELTTH